MPHNRGTSRRITAMGFIKDRLNEGLWMTTAGGEVWKTQPGAVDTRQASAAAAAARTRRAQPRDKMQIRS